MLPLVRQDNFSWYNLLIPYMLKILSYVKIIYLIFKVQNLETSFLNLKGKIFFLSSLIIFSLRIIILKPDFAIVKQDNFS